MLAEQAFYSVPVEVGKEDEAQHHATVLARYLQNQIFTVNPADPPGLSGRTGTSSDGEHHRALCASHAKDRC